MIITKKVELILTCVARVFLPTGSEYGSWAAECRSFDNIESGSEHRLIFILFYVTQFLFDWTISRVNI